MSHDTPSSENSSILDLALTEYFRLQDEGIDVDIEQFLGRYPGSYRQRLADLIRTDGSLTNSSAGTGLPECTTHLAPNEADLGDKVGALRAGHILGDYRIDREIGRGGMGVVYEARQVSLDRRVALKVLPADASFDNLRRKRFRNEAVAVAQLQHPNIIPIYGVGDEEGTLYFAMRLISGQNLARVVRSIRDEVSSRSGGLGEPGNPMVETRPQDGRTGDDNGSLNAAGLSANDYPDSKVTRRFHAGSRYFRSVAQVGFEVASALDHAHSAGIRHRDIKPSNVMVDEDGHIWVTDFGLAQMQTKEELTPTGDILGTLRYMSPEQASGRPGLVDHRTDIYSLGATLYELATLQHAVQGSSTPQILRNAALGNPVALSRHNPNIPVDLGLIIQKAIARDPEDRFETAAEMAAELARFIANEPIRTRKPTLTYRCRNWLRRHPQLTMTTLVGVAVAFLVATTASAFIYEGYLSEQSERTKAEAALLESEGSRLLASSALWLDQNPGLALQLAIKGAERVPGPEASAALLMAMDACHEKRTITTEEVLMHVSASPDGQTFVGCPRSAGNSVLTVFHAGTQIPGKQLHPNGRYSSSAFDITGRHLVIASQRVKGTQSAPVLYDTTSWQKRRSFSDHSLGHAAQNVFSADGRWVVLPRRDSGADVIVLASGEVEATLRDNGRRIVSACFDSSGRRVGTIFEDGGVAVWDMESRKVTKRCPPVVGVTAQVTGGVFLPGNNFLAVTRTDSTQFYSLENDGPKEPVFSNSQLLAVDNTRSIAVVAARRYSSVKVIDTATLRRVNTISLPDGVLSVAIRDGYLLCHCVGRTGGGLYVYDAATGLLDATLKGHLNGIAHAEFGSTSDTIVTSGADKTLRIWSRMSGRSARSFGEVAFGAVQGRHLVDEGQMVTIVRPPRLSMEVRDPVEEPMIGPALPGSATRTTPLVGCQTLLTYAGNKVFAWDGTTRRRVGSCEFPEPVMSAYATKLSKAVVRSTSGQVWLWDYADFELKRLTDPTEPALARVAKSLVAIADYSGRIRVLNLESGESRQIATHSNRIQALQLSSDEERLLIVDRGGRVRIWSLTRQADSVEFVPDSHKVQDARFVSEGNYVITWGTEGKPVELRDSATGQMVARQEPGQLNRVDVVGSKILFVPRKSQAEVWDVESNSVTKVGPTPVSQAVLLEKHVVTLADDAEGPILRVWDSATTALQREERLDHRPRLLVPTPSRSRFMLRRDNHDVDILRYKNGEQVTRLTGQSQPVLLKTHNKSGDQWLTVSADGWLRFFSIQGQLTAKIRGHDERIKAAANSPDGDFSVTGDESGDLILWNNTSRTKERALGSHSAGIVSISFPHNHSATTVCRAGEVRLWDLRESDPEVFRPEGGAATAELSRDGDTLLVRTKPVGDAPPQAVLIDVATKKQTRLANTAVLHAEYSPDGDHIVCISRSRHVTVYNAKSRLQVLRIPYGNVRAAAFDPVQDRIAVLQPTGLSIWDLSKRTEAFRVPFASPASIPFRVGAPPRSQVLPNWHPFNAAGDELLVEQGGEFFRWPLQPLEKAKRAAPRNLTSQEVARFVNSRRQTPSDKGARDAEGDNGVGGGEGDK